jgi:hypothetical protein
MISISNIEPNDFEEVLILGESIFKPYDSGVRGTLNYKTDWNISLKLTMDNKIIGFYLFCFQNISSHQKCKGLKGVEGVALGVDENHRGKGYSDLLINESYKQFKQSHDYIWGMHLNTLNVESFWTKRRTIIHQTNSFFVSLKMFDYKVQIPLLRQPDTISCGNTCIKMILDYLGNYNNVSITQIIDICGTNRFHGTRDIEMRAGLEYFNIPHCQNITSGDESKQIDYLKTVLKMGNVFFLRTLINGMKHWVIVYGFSGDSYYINDPAQGTKTYTVDRLIEIWKPRAYDGFEIILNKI